MKQEDKEAIVESQKIHSAIGSKLKENSDKVKDKVDLTNIAKSLASRRKRVLRDPKESEEGEK